MNGSLIPVPFLGGFIFFCGFVLSSFNVMVLFYLFVLYFVKKKHEYIITIILGRIKILSHKKCSINNLLG